MKKFETSKRLLNRCWEDEEETDRSSFQKTSKGLEKHKPQRENTDQQRQYCFAYDFCAAAHVLYVIKETPQTKDQISFKVNQAI